MTQVGLTIKASVVGQTKCHKYAFNAWSVTNRCTRIHDRWQGNQSPHKAIRGVTRAIKTTIKGLQRLEKNDEPRNYLCPENSLDNPSRFDDQSRCCWTNKVHKYAFNAWAITNRRTHIYNRWQGNQSPHKAIRGVTRAIKTTIKGLQWLEKLEIYINHLKT